MTGEILRNLESDKSGAAIVDALTEIWQRVLQRPNIGPEDDFHTLGGHEALADKMFAEISQIFGRQLPAATICHASTIAALAAILQQPTLPRFSPFVKLKAGTGKIPILIAHGLDGRARFSKLAKHICTEHSIYGIQAKGIDGLEQPFDRIEDMTAYYLAALHEFQPLGPYILIGYSFGGLVALEMAQRLAETGKQIALLVLIDTYPHPGFLSLGERLRLMSRRIRRHISEITQRSTRDAFSYFVLGLKHRLHVAGVHSPGMAPPATFRLAFARTTVQVQERAYLAYRRYRPRFYRGKIKFVRAEVNSYFPDDPAPVWTELAEELEVSTVPGGHLDMLTTEFESLARVLTGCLQGVPGHD
jgi:thioesterase domain-containing protein